MKRHTARWKGRLARLLRLGLPIFFTAVTLPACYQSAQSGYLAPDAVQIIGEPGRGPGQFVLPRSVAISPDGSVFVVDKSGRIQRLDGAGNPIGGWCLPYVADPTKHRGDPQLAERPSGYPIGLSFDALGRMFVADTHYHRVLVYQTDGTLIGQFGEFGHGPGQFIFPTSVAFDSEGRVYVAEYGGNDRIQVFGSDFRYLSEFGAPGRAAGQLSRPNALLMDPSGHRLWVADACNHRLCLYSREGTLIRTVGELGDGPGQFSYPYGLAWDADGNLLVVEMGNSRLQKLSPEGEYRESWGRRGSGIAGQLKSPWAVAVDAQGHLLVADTANHRLVRFRWR